MYPYHPRFFSCNPRGCVEYVPYPCEGNVYGYATFYAQAPNNDTITLIGADHVEITFPRKLQGLSPVVNMLIGYRSEDDPNKYRVTIGEFSGEWLEVMRTLVETLITQPELIEQKVGEVAHIPRIIDLFDYFGIQPLLKAYYSYYYVNNKTEVDRILSDINSIIRTELKKNQDQTIADIIQSYYAPTSDKDWIVPVVLERIKKVDLFNLNLTQLKANVFQGLSSLENLNLWENRLTGLPERLFQGLSSLRMLNLSNNELTELPERLFEGLSSLRMLILSKNQLTKLPEKLCEGLSRLKNLFLSENQLNELPEKLFEGLSSLIRVTLYHNQLTKLPEKLFRGLSSLQALQLYDNLLITLPEKLFEGLSLEKLWLNDNQLTELPDNLFDGLTSLTMLWLNDNQLTELPKRIFQGLTSLSKLDLSENKLKQSKKEFKETHVLPVGVKLEYNPQG